MTQPSEQPDPQAWRCTSTDPGEPTARCALPVDHSGRDAVNNWDLHQDEEGYQW